jgi:phosphate uptake regulator
MVTNSQHISQQFEKELQDIRSSVLAMGGLIEQQVANAQKALMISKSASMKPVFKLLRYGSRRQAICVWWQVS